MMSCPSCWLYLVGVLGAAPNSNGNPAEAITSADPERSEKAPLIEPADRCLRNWSVQAGVGFISKSDIGDVLSGGFSPAEGDSGGQVYSLMLNWTAHRFEIPGRERLLMPQFEPYLNLTLVDENGGSFFPDYNGGVGFRWVDFPWNRWVKTSFFVGFGLSYSSQVYAIDRESHPGEERSHLKLDWPMHLTFAVRNGRSTSSSFSLITNLAVTSLTKAASIASELATGSNSEVTRLLCDNADSGPN
jgi:hypothetical protein